MLRENTIKLEDESKLRKKAKKESEETYYFKTEVIKLLKKCISQKITSLNINEWIEENL